MEIRLVQEVSWYDYVGRDGKEKKGLNINSIGNFMVDRDGQKGVPVYSEFTKDVEFRKNFPKVPGFYKMNYQMVPGRGGSPVNELISAEFIQEVDLISVFQQLNSNELDNSSKSKFPSAVGK